MFKNKVVWIIIAIVAILFFWVKGVYNNMVTQDEGVKTAWSQVENQYQRRMDLILYGSVYCWLVLPLLFSRQRIIRSRPFRTYVFPTG